ncbi:MAG: phosphoribosylanthranilate isomerase [Caldilineaceae bacterium]|nr:phosphoribosylanthranilate isomerase [Caldilineaceae bacterium]
MTIVKICGITNLADAEVAAAAGADLLGFIFYPRSARYVEPETVRGIIEELRLKIGSSADREEITHPNQPAPSQPISNRQSPIPPPQSSIFNLQPPISLPPRFVGVFVNEPLSRIEKILALTGLDYAQLHGDEPPEITVALAGRAYKALGPADDRQAAQEAARYAGLGVAGGPGWLMDAYAPRAYGGTGRRADWPTAARLAARHPGLLLAGGLTPDNVAAAIAAVRPWGVDVASGVEAEPGRKDHVKVRTFIRRVREIEE